ncbi:MAG: DDE-type integrase/transposase/recombinase [Candidatus Binatia bacterium]
MPKSHKPYPRELKARLIEMVRGGRTPEELAEKFEPTAQSIRNWVAQAERDVGRRTDGLTTDERVAAPASREQGAARRAGDLKKGRGLGLLGRPARFRRRIRVRESTSGPPPHRHALLRAGCLPQRVLRVAHSTGVGTGNHRRAADQAAARRPRVYAGHIWGAPRTRRTAGPGVRVGHNRVARLMRAAGLAGVSRRKHAVTPIRGRDAHGIPDLVTRNFTAAGPNQLWVADITYIPTWAGCLYLAIVLDAGSRRIVGGRWQRTAHRARARGALDGVHPAPADQRHPPLRSGVSVHVDRRRAALSRKDRTALDGIGR